MASRTAWSRCYYTIKTFYRDQARLTKIADEPLSYHAEKMRNIVTDYRHEFQDIHCRVHWCHKGGGACPICPVVEVAETASGDLLDIAIKLRKKYKIQIMRKTKPNGTWTWQLKTLK